MARFPKPCLDCGALTTGGLYCLRHATARETLKNERERVRKAGRTLYRSPEYKRIARLIRDTATVCHLCGGGYRQGDPFTADHVIAGDPLSPLAPAHRSCNSARGNKPLND
jgi:hypothetical protein